MRGTWMSFFEGLGVLAWALQRYRLETIHRLLA
jgi:hypothetical protein